MSKTNFGRPTKRTPEVIMKLEYAFSIGGTIGAACQYAGISLSTYHSWGESDPEFREHMTLLKEKPVLKALETVNASLGDPAVARWYLEKRNPDFKPKSESDVRVQGLEVAGDILYRKDRSSGEE